MDRHQMDSVLDRTAGGLGQLRFGMSHDEAVTTLDSWRQLQQGFALAVVQKMLGHSDVRVTRGYTHVSSLLAQDAAARLGRALFAETSTNDQDH